MRKAYQRRLPENPAKDYYFIHRLTGNTQPLLIEYGFIDNPTDLNKLNNNILDYGEAVVRALTKYIGIPYNQNEDTSGNVYVVKPGDSLYSIARQFGISIDELKATNNLTSNLLSIGQQLKLPVTTPESTLPSDYIIYTVVSGDTLYKIANQYGVSVNDIIDFNQLSSTMLTINQQILIPVEKEEKPIQNYYTVVAGDSLYKIANQYGVTIDNLIQANNLTTTLLNIGDTLIIPTSGIIDSENNETFPNEENSNNSNQTIEYVVKNGDSLYSISKKFNITVAELKEYNNLTSNLLTIGQVLFIPSTQAYKTYYVKSGDSLYCIAKNNNTTVDEIKRINNLTSNLLTIGQVLILP